MNENLDNLEKDKDIKIAEKNDKKPDENLGFMFSSAVKMYDPSTNEVILQVRGDY